MTLVPLLFLGPSFFGFWSFHRLCLGRFHSLCLWRIHRSSLGSCHNGLGWFYRCSLGAESFAPLSFKIIRCLEYPVGSHSAWAIRGHWKKAKALTIPDTFMVEKDCGLWDLVEVMSVIIWLGFAPLRMIWKRYIFFKGDVPPSDVFIDIVWNSILNSRKQPPK